MSTCFIVLCCHLVYSEDILNLLHANFPPLLSVPILQHTETITTLLLSSTQLRHTWNISSILASLRASFRCRIMRKAMAVSRLAAAARVLTIEWCRGSVLGWARPTPCRGGVCFYNSIVTQSGRGGGGPRKQFEHCAANTKLIKAQQFKCINPTLSPEQRLNS